MNKTCLPSVSRIFCIGLVAMLFVACKPSKPAGVMGEGKLEDVLYDYTLAMSMSDVMALPEGTDREALRYQYVQKVFEKHHITEAYFDSSMVWYAANGVCLNEIYGRINERLDAESKDLGVDLSETELYASYTADGDTANVWNGSRIFYVDNYKPENVKIINIPVDSTFLPGDSYKLSFNAHFLPEKGGHKMYAMFCLYYEDSCQVAQTQLISGNYHVELNLNPNARQDTLQPKRIVITFYNPPIAQDMPHQLFYLTHPAVLRMHKPLELRKNKAKNDELLTDSLEADTLIRPEKELIQPRLTPLEERDMREERHDIKIVKERVTAPAQKRRVRAKR